MKVGIIGFARSGKTTVFNALTGAHAEVGAFGSRDANIATLKVPDIRLERLAAIHKPKKITYAEFQFVDVAPNESGGEDKALDPSSLALLKNADALVHVVRAFENDSVMHPKGSVNPERDCMAMEEELQFADLVIIEKRVQRLEKENRKDSEYQVLRRALDHVESGQSLRTMAFSAQEDKDIRGFEFLSLKPLMLLANYGEDHIGQDDPAGLTALASRLNLPMIALCGEMEMEIAGLPEEERAAFRQELGLGGESRMEFLRAAYDMLGVMSFLTAGEPEVRAWTIPKHTRAVEAAGAIHSDIQRGFIRAEIVAYEDFIAAGSMVKAKEAGRVRLEGKDYIVQDGDIILFRFNV